MKAQKVINEKGEAVGFLECFRAPSFSESRNGWNALSLSGQIIAGAFAYKVQALSVFGAAAKTERAGK